MKKLILFVLVIGSSMIASADLLYWMVDQSGAETSQRVFEFAFAELYAKDAQGNKVEFADGLYGSVAPDNISTAPNLYTSIGNVATYENYTFYIELYNESGVAQVAPYTLGGLNAVEDFIKKSAMDTTAPYMATTFAAPEPTSGLLMLLGVGLLALKRKKA